MFVDQKTTAFLYQIQEGTILIEEGIVMNEILEMNS